MARKVLGTLLLVGLLGCTPAFAPAPKVQIASSRPSLFATNVFAFCGPDFLPEISITFGNRPDLDGQTGVLSFSTGGSVFLVFRSNQTTTIAYPNTTQNVNLIYSLGPETATASVVYPEDCVQETTTTTTSTTTSTTTTTTSVPTTTTSTTSTSTTSMPTTTTSMPVPTTEGGAQGTSPTTSFVPPPYAMPSNDDFSNPTPVIETPIKFTG